MRRSNGLAVVGFAGVALLGALGGCVVGRAGWGGTWGAPVGVAATMPPPAFAEPVGPVGVGAPGQVWVDGHYDWRGGTYAWVPGHWEQPPQPGWAWQQPAWHNNRWHAGYWHAPNVAVPPVYANTGAWNPGWRGGGWGGGAVATPARPVGVQGGWGGGAVATPARPVGVQGGWGGGAAVVAPAAPAGGAWASPAVAVPAR